jgi:hypothetical protein
MRQLSEYNTYGAAFDGYDVTYFCYNDKMTTIEEFLILQDKAFRKAMQRQWRLFKKYETLETDVELRVCLN